MLNTISKDVWKKLLLALQYVVAAAVTITIWPSDYSRYGVYVLLGASLILFIFHKNLIDVENMPPEKQKWMKAVLKIFTVIMKWSLILTVVMVIIIAAFFAFLALSK